ncbi:dTMP kinase [Hutsoniella sourekii]|uniref:dTMP kinase n=1 Tax=Hutsoniella sourekii TaxID=87650 RepID=UPI0004831D43|nr:dTMP kinase [Hutsoniella sourekii]
MLRQRFISIEGPDGSGKSTVVKQLGQRLQERGLDPLLTREPGGSPIAEQIREVILHTGNTAMDIRTETLLYAAARRQHLSETILPALEAGRLVITDRYVDSSLAYQGAARDIPMELVWQINQFAIEDFLPSLTLLIDVPSQIGLERIHQARGQRQYDRLDQEDLSFHQASRQAFLDLAKQAADRFVVIDGCQPIEQVVDDCLDTLAYRQIIDK